MWSEEQDASLTTMDDAAPSIDDSAASWNAPDTPWNAPEGTMGPGPGEDTNVGDVSKLWAAADEAEMAATETVKMDVSVNPREVRQEDESPRSVSHYLAAMAVIALVLLGILAVLFYFVRRNRPSRPGPSAARRYEKGVRAITSMMWFVVAIVVVIAVGAVLGLGGLAVLQAVERSKLFQPTAVSRYSKVSGKWYPLPGGGGLLHCTPNADPRSRPVLFAHGNTLNLDPYASALDRFATCNYNIWALEYGGYGMTDGSSPCCTSLERDMREAWDICGRDDAIIIGFSMGGALLGQVYDTLTPLPAQIVFLNTFWSVPELVASKVPMAGSTISSLVETQWVTKPPKRFCGKVVIVWSKDDDIVPPEHSAELCAIFNPLKPVCVELPKGGHRWSSFCFMSSWCNETILLPA